MFKHIGKIWDLMSRQGSRRDDSLWPMVPRAIDYTTRFLIIFYNMSLWYADVEEISETGTEARGFTFTIIYWECLLWSYFWSWIFYLLSCGLCCTVVCLIETRG